MRRIYLLILIVFSLAANAEAQRLSGTGPEILDLKESSHNFGKIRQGKPVTYNFVFVNKGTSPLVIENVEATCGCTTPEWDDEPIAPGKQSVIKVGFNASTEGTFSKTITIHYNAGSVRTLTISGEVYPSPTTSAPVNTSLSLLKQ